MKTNHAPTACRPPTSRRRRQVTLATVSVVTLALALAACNSRVASGGGTDTSTHWVKSCVVAQDCGGGTECLCGTCTLKCGSDAACKGLAEDAVCSQVADECAEPICVAPDGQGAISAPDAGTPPALIPKGPAPTWSVRDEDRNGAELALDADGNVFVVGGQSKSEFDLSVVFVNPWVAKYDTQGAQLWEQIISDDEATAGSNGRSLALDAAGNVTIVTTNFDGMDTPTLRRYSGAGDFREQFKLVPGITVLRSSPEGELIGAGSRLVEFRDGRPFTEIWVGGIAQQAVTWEHKLRGVDGSISSAWDLATTPSGGYYVAGSLGTDPESNASDPWLGAGSAGAASEDDWAWQDVPTPSAGNSRTVSVSTTPDGGALAIGYGSRSFLTRYAADGAVVWTRDVNGAPGVVLASVDGYLLGVGADASAQSTGVARLDYVSWDNEVLWRLDTSDCTQVVDLALDGSAVIALMRCNDSLGLARYEL